MRVKIGDTWYDARDVPIMYQFDQEDQMNIAAWDWQKCPNGKYARTPGDSTLTNEQVEAWMDDELILGSLENDGDTRE